MAGQKIRIKLKSFDHNLIDKSAEKIIKTVKSTGAIVSGPIPLPTKRSVYTVNRSPHVDKKSREQFEMRIHKRLVDIIEGRGDRSSITGKEQGSLNAPRR